MLINRLVERATSLRGAHRELARRARDARRRPLIVVPPVMGVRLVDDRQRAVWGATLRLFGGDGPADVDAVTPAGPVEGFTLIPRLYQRDVFGGLLRYLVRVYGADLFVLDYDWRRPARRRRARARPADRAGARRAGDESRST